MKPTMSMPDATISAVFAGTFVVAYVVWKFVRNTHKQVTRRPPAMWSLPLIGSILFLPDFRTWHRVFLRMSAETGNVFALYIGSQYVSCIPLMLTTAYYYLDGIPVVSQLLVVPAGFLANCYCTIYTHYM